MVPVGEFPTRWEAQVAIAQLETVGIEAAMLGDPADQVAPHHVTERMVLVVVREEVAEEAAQILAGEGVDPWTERMDAAYFERRFADRPPWVRYATWALILAIPAPLALSGIYLAYRGLEGLFP